MKQNENYPAGNSQEKTLSSYIKLCSLSREIMILIERISPLNEENLQNYKIVELEW